MQDVHFSSVLAVMLVYSCRCDMGIGYGCCWVYVVVGVWNVEGEKWRRDRHSFLMHAGLITWSATRYYQLSTMAAIHVLLSTEERWLLIYVTASDSSG